MPQQRHRERGCTGGIRRQRARCQRRHRPARRRRARHWCGHHAQHQYRHAGSVRGQRQPPAVAQVKPPRLAPQVDQHRSQCRALRRFACGMQHRLDGSRSRQRQPRGIEPQRGETLRVQRADFAIECLVPDPQDRASGGGTDRRTDRKARCCRRRSTVRCIDLMHRTARESATKRRIDTCRTEREQRVPLTRRGSKTRQKRGGR